MLPIQSIDHIAISRRNNLSPQLSGWRDFTFFNLKVSVENRELFNRFGRRYSRVDFIDRLLHQPAQGPSLRECLRELIEAARNSLRPREFGSLYRIQCYQSHEVTLPFTVNQRMTDQVMFFQQILDQRRCNFLPGRSDNQFLLSSSDFQEAVSVYLADISRQQPAIAEHCRSLFRRFVVTAEHRIAADKDFAIVGNLYLTARHWWANRAEFVILGTIESHADVFRQAIGLQNRQAGSIEELSHFKIQGRTAGSCQTNTATEILFDVLQGGR